jgi:hypothetical protein
MASLLCALCASGCTPHKPEAKTSGVVRFEGRPVSNALVTFVNRDLGVLMTAPGDAKGRYRMLGAKGIGLPPGEYRVYVEPKSFYARIVTGEAVPAKPPCPADIPEKYHTAETSGLTCAMKDGDNTFDIDMKP